MNLGYEVSKKAILEHIERERQQRALRAEQWKQLCSCGKSISYEQRRNQFCSQSCAASHTNATRKRLKTCPLCGARFAGRTRRCPQCVSERGLSTGDSPFNSLMTDAARRRRLLKELGHVCQICGILEWRGAPTPVVLDHIDGNADNNVRENCRLACPNCNAQLPTFSGRNKGKGRSVSRNKRKHPHPQA